MLAIPCPPFGNRGQHRGRTTATSDNFEQGIAGREVSRARLVRFGISASEALDAPGVNVRHLRFNPVPCDMRAIVGRAVLDHQSPALQMMATISLSLPGFRFTNGSLVTSSGTYSGLHDFL